MTQGKLAPLVFLARALRNASDFVEYAEDWLKPEEIPAFTRALAASLAPLAVLLESTAADDSKQAPGPDQRLQGFLVGCARELQRMLRMMERTTNVSNPADSQTADHFPQEAEELRRLRNGDLEP